MGVTLARPADYTEINRGPTPAEYDAVADCALRLGTENALFQEIENMGASAAQF